MRLTFDTKRGFGSDNHAGVHPRLMQSLIDANVGHLPSYGTDPLTAATVRLFREHFQRDCEVYFTYNGTAANVLALRSITDSFHSVLVAEQSHLHVDECAAPEAIGRCKLVPVPAKNGKISVESVRPFLRRWGDQHFAQPKVISITQPTELGTLYEPQEILELGRLTKAHNMWLHVDGARFLVAAQALGKSFAELTTDLGVDILSFGGTKNSLMFGEAVVFINPSCHHAGVKFLRKQLMQLPSKTRFIAAQFYELLYDGLWREIAAHELSCAQSLARKLKDIPEVTITRPVQANSVFAILPRALLKELRRHYFFYVWDEFTSEVRLMMAFDTKEEDIVGFIQYLKELIEKAKDHKEE